jgi:UDP-glucose 4-epimerase
MYEVRIMKVLITGVTGFIGSHLVKELEGNEVYGLVRFGDMPVQHEGYKPVYGDLTDYHYLAKTIKGMKPDIVVHLAGLTSVSQSFERPQEYFEVNTLGTINLAEICLKYDPPLQKFIWAGTPEEYGIQEKYPIREDAPLRPNSPYALSKMAATQYMLYLSRAYDFPVVVSRHANAYGRKFGIFSQLGVIENTITQMLNGKDVCLGQNVWRDFLYIDDILTWYQHLLKSAKAGEIYNAGWGKAHSIEELVETTKKLTNFKGKVFWNALPARPGEIQKIELDYSKAKRELGWKPEVEFKSGLRSVVKYFKNDGQIRSKGN